MIKKVYKFNLDIPFSFYKAGQYQTDKNWQHKDITNINDFEFFVVISGSVYIQIANEKFELHEQECLIIPPKIRHFGYKSSPENTEFFWAHFYPNGLFTESNDIIVGKEPIIGQKFPLFKFSKIILLFRQMLDSANDPDASLLSNDFFISSLALELSSQFIHSAVYNNQIKDNSRFETIKNWIRTHSHTSLSVKQVSDEFSITTPTLNRMFHKHLNCTTIHFINKIKIEQSIEMLLTTDITIKGIAFNLGFYNEKYFFKVFKQIIGVTPSEFRNANSRTYLNNQLVDPEIPDPTIH
ncbi:helix-turn-helix domain-containing protein [Dellaglioa sp. L3N]